VNVPIINGTSVPDTEEDAIKQNWRFRGVVQPELRAAPPLTSMRVQTSCMGKPAGTLCDAIRHADGTVEAYYCDDNHLCTRSYGPP
jgi:hypothetical protein